jgi:glycerophosphoryl diester phosphodiesterase
VKITGLTLDDIKSDNYLLPDGEHIPLFSEMLELIDGKTGILLELKFAGLGNYQLEKEVYKLIKDKQSWIAVQAFNPYTVIWFANNAPEFYRGLLSMAPLVWDIFIFYKRMKPQFISFQVDGIKIIKNFMTKNKLNLNAWTVNTATRYDFAINNGVNNIIFENIDLDTLNFTQDKLSPPVDNF